MGSRWTRSLMFLTFSALVLISGFNLLVDPLQQYKIFTAVKPVYLNPRYLNAGIAKSHTYDSVVVGTSMSENFFLNDVSSLLNFKNPVKLTISGANVHDINRILDTAYKYQNIKDVLCDIHYYSYTGEVHTFSKGATSLPGYLYDDNLFNDYQYLMNIDTVKLSLRALKFNIFNADNILLDQNRMYQWQHNFLSSFGKENIWRAWRSRSKDIKVETMQASEKFERLKNNFDVNLLPIIEKHPETNFYFYYPPYSILKYKQFMERSWLGSALKFKKYVFDVLNEYPNVKIYDFQIAEEITHNLNTYRDISHYHQNTNHWILEQIRDDNYRVSHNNVNNINKKLLHQIDVFDFENE